MGKSQGGAHLDFVTALLIHHRLIRPQALRVWFLLTWNLNQYIWLAAYGVEIMFTVYS